MAKFSASDFERTGGVMRGFGSVTISGDEKLSALQKKFQRIEQPPEERFAEYVSAISHSMTERGVVSISNDDLDVMLSAPRVASIKTKYLNPTAYILGYAVVSGGRIDEKLLKKLMPKLADATDGKVTPADLIRYARFWLSG